MMSSKNHEWPVGFKGLVGIASCAMGLGVVYFSYGVGTDSVKNNAAVAPAPAAQPDRKRPVRAMNMALGNMVFFARDLGFTITSGEEGAVDGNKIAARIEGQLQEIRELYREQIIHNPSLAGGLTLQLDIGPTGEVSEVRELSSRINDGDFKQRLIAAASKWSFGDVSGNRLQVTCPLLFVHEGMDITTLVQWEKYLAQQSGNAGVMQPAAAAQGVKEFQIKYATALRKDASFSSASLQSLTVGTKVAVLKRQGDWVEVRLTKSGPTGFVRKEFVTAVEVARR